MITLGCKKRMKANLLNTVHPPRQATTSDIELESCAPQTHSLVIYDEILESECNLNAVDNCSEKSMGHDSTDHKLLYIVLYILFEHQSYYSFTAFTSV